jgi:hypothetical protein
MAGPGVIGTTDRAGIAGHDEEVSDTPPDEGWWRSDDGQWYPPQVPAPPVIPIDQASVATEMPSRSDEVLIPASVPRRRQSIGIASLVAVALLAGAVAVSWTGSSRRGTAGEPTTTTAARAAPAPTDSAQRNYCLVIAQTAAKLQATLDQDPSRLSPAALASAMTTFDMIFGARRDASPTPALRAAWSTMLAELTGQPSTAPAQGFDQASSIVDDYAQKVCGHPGDM